MVKGMGFLAICIVGLPLLLLYGIVWLICAGLIFVACAALICLPIVLVAWGWDKSHWLGAFIVACYVIAFLVWKMVGDHVKSEWYARGWWVTRGYKNRRYLAQYAPKHR